MELNDTWDGVESERDGAPFILHFRPFLQNFIETKKYNKRLDIIWTYNSPDSSSMPADEDMEFMDKVEDALVDILEKDQQAVLSFIYTGQNQQVWYWYSSDIDETIERLNEALANFEQLPIELNPVDDPEWTEYNGVLEDTKDAS